MDNLRRKIFSAIVDGNNPYKLFISESKLLTEAHQCLMEEIVSWMWIQIQLIKDLLNFNEIDIWGHGFDSDVGDWSNYDLKRKQLMVMTYLDKIGILKQLRDHINNSKDTVRVGTNDYDIKEIISNFKPPLVSPEFLKEFRKSKIYKDLLNIALTGIKTGQTTLQP